MTKRKMYKYRYPYRFKTREEFIQDYGEDWKTFLEKYGPDWVSSMDHLFGKDFPITKDSLNDINTSKFPIDNRWHDSHSRHNWEISWQMLTPNKQPIPNYKPKRIIRKI